MQKTLYMVRLTTCCRSFKSVCPPNAIRPGLKDSPRIAAMKSSRPTTRSPDFRAPFVELVSQITFRPCEVARKTWGIPPPLLRIENGLDTMADLSKLLDELSNLTVLEAAELARMLEEKWGAVEVGRPGEVPTARKPDEAADTKLIKELIFQPWDVVLQPFSKKEMAKGKTPDFKLMKGAELSGYCELKSPRDDWIFEFPDDIKPGESATETRSSPTSNNLARQIISAAEQFDAINPDHELPNVLVLVNHAAGRTRSDLHVTLGGIPVPGAPHLFALKPDHQKEVWKAARRIDLIFWVDPQKRSCQPLYANDAIHRAAACDLLGIKTGEQKVASDLLSP